ncbi:MAG: type II secretion system minor pseudopilin GspJ [Wenzhouxiangella sp.]|nr:type II secretion system minor pseudopilin GspJ [Wenzhouxiangella sp.]
MKPGSRRRKVVQRLSGQGYTLVEVLIAVVVFAVLAASAYTALNGLARAALEQRERSQSLASLQLAIARLDADLRQIASRPARQSDGSLAPALRGERQRLTATRAGWANPVELRRSQLQRFAWTLEQDRLVRLSWPVTDIVAATQPMPDPALGQVRDLSFRYRDASGRWHEQWPPAQGQQSALPVAIEVSVDSREHGQIRRLLVLAR